MLQERSISSWHGDALSEVKAVCSLRAAFDVAKIGLQWNRRKAEPTTTTCYRLTTETGRNASFFSRASRWHEESASADDLRAPLGEYSHMRCAGKPIGRECEGGGARWRPLSNTRGFLASSDRNVPFGALDDLR